MRSVKRRGLIAVAALAILLILGGAAVAVSADRVLPNVRVGAFDLGGLTFAEARAALRSHEADFGSRTVELRFGTATWSSTNRELGIALDSARIAAEIEGFGHRRSALAVAADWTTAILGGGVVIEPPRTAPDDSLARFVTGAAAAIDRPPVEGGVTVSASGVSARRPQTGLRVDREAAIAAALAPGDGSRVVLLSTAIVAPEIDAAAIDEAARDAVAATRALTFGLDGDSLVVPAERLRGVAQVERADAEGVAALELRWSEAGVSAIATEVAVRFERERVSAVLVPGDQRLEVVPGHDAFAVDRAAVRAAVVDGWRDAAAAERIVPVPGRRTPPDLTTEAARAIAERTTLLGGFTTYFPVNYERAVNIGLAARAFDGQTISPGGSFSFWDRIGEVSAAAGYLQAGTIIGGRSSYAIGGGLCQVSTTMFNAVAQAGYRIDERHPHSYYIERYPLGRDAAVFEGQQDLRWTNDTTQPAYLRATATATSITFWLYAAPTGRVVEIGTPVQWNLRHPAADQPADPQHAPGYVVDGRDVNVTRTVRDESGARTETWFSHYAPIWGGPLP